MKAPIMKSTRSCRTPLLLLAAALPIALATPLFAADQFAEVTTPGWTNSTQYSYTGAWGDYDKDGFIDLFVANSARNLGASTNFLYRNAGDGTFIRQVTDTVGPVASDSSSFTGGCWGDVNNDGNIDLLALSSPPPGSTSAVTPRLYLNRGNGRFASIDAEDLSRKYYGGWWGGMADYDRDGNLDAFLAASWAATGHQTNLLFRGHGDGTFNLVTKSSVFTSKVADANDATWADYDNDGWPDLLVANGDSRGLLYHNEGHGQFTRRTGSLLETVYAWHHHWGDYDNDGFLDLLATSAGGTRLLRNTGAGDFLLVTNYSTASSGVPIWADYDNDGYLDFLVVRGQNTGAQVQLFHQNRDGTFSRVQDACTRPTAQWLGGGWGDYDNDGFLDLFLAEDRGRNALYHNVGSGNNWIKFQLEGVVANRTAIGAKVRVKATIGGGSVWQLREVSAGNFCQNDLRPNFGLGDATNVDLVRIEWPSGNVQEWSDLAPNQIVAVRESVNITPTKPTSSLNGSISLARLLVVNGSYQWQFDGVDLLAQTNRILTLTNLQGAQQGRYSVIVTTADLVVTNYVCLNVDASFTKITSPPAGEKGLCYSFSWADYNNDGFQDLLVLNGAFSATRTNSLYRNNGDGTFTRQTADQVGTVVSDPGGWRGSSWGDYDNDGLLELYLTQSGRQALYHQTAAGQFTRITNNLVGDSSFGEQSCWGDYDNDGLLDLFVATADYGYFKRGPNSLYHNDGGGVFTKITTGPIALDIPVGDVSWSACWTDFDNDGDLDLVSGGGLNNRMFVYRNDGHGAFEAIQKGALAEDKFYVGNLTWGDYDNDGLPDLFAADYDGKCRLFHNDGNANFTKIIFPELAPQAQIGAWADYDNDGYLDVYVSRGLLSSGQNQLYHNNGDGTFSRVTTGSLVTDSGHRSQGAWADYDNDGFMDLFVPDFGQGGNVLYHNNENGNHWLAFRLVGTASNRGAIGAKVRVKATIGGKTFWQLRTISAQGEPQEDMRPHFGLGDAVKSEIVRIEWPSGNVQEFSNVAADQFLAVWEQPAVKATIQQNGTCRLTITAQPNSHWRVESSNNLHEWHVLATGINATERFEVSDAESLSLSCRFYRVTRD
jgi:enediyne biosynthesis protein E4